MTRGNSFANGDSASGPYSPQRWHAGWQTPPPVSIYVLAEGERYQ